MKKTLLLSFIIVLFLLGLIQLYGVRISQADNNGGPSPAVVSKLQEILDNQKTILQKLDDIKQELEVVKIRATRK